MRNEFKLSKTKVAKLLGVGISTVDRMASDGLLSYRQYVTGGRMLFSENEINEFMEKRTVLKTEE